jgi:hypothetical protein
MKCKNCYWLMEWRGEYFCYMDFHRDCLKIAECEDYITKKEMKARYPGLR